MLYQIIGVSDDLISNNIDINKSKIIKYIIDLKIEKNVTILLVPFDTYFQKMHDLLKELNSNISVNEITNDNKNIECVVNNDLLSFLNNIRELLKDKLSNTIIVNDKSICTNYNYSNVIKIIYKKTDKYISLKDKIYNIVENYVNISNIINQDKEVTNFLFHIIDDYTWANEIIEELYPIFSLYLLIKKYLSKTNTNTKKLNDIIQIFIKNTNYEKKYENILKEFPKLTNNEKLKLEVLLQNNIVNDKFMYFNFTLEKSTEPLLAFINEINKIEDYKKVAMKIFVEYLNLTLLFFTYKNINKFQSILVNINDIDSNRKNNSLII